MSLLVGRSGAKLAPEMYGVTKIAQLCLVMWRRRGRECSTADDEPLIIAADDLIALDDN